jgi:hypothetical protein
MSEEIKKLERKNIAIKIMALYADQKLKNITLDQVIEQGEKLIKDYETKLKTI